MASYCIQCGNMLSPEASFCSKCGAAVAGIPRAAGRPLMRPRMGRQIAGVCAALARSYGWDVTAVRIILVVLLVLSSGIIGVAYLAAWVGIPEETPATSQVYPPGV